VNYAGKEKSGEENSQEEDQKSPSQENLRLRPLWRGGGGDQAGIRNDPFGLLRRGDAAEEEIKICSCLIYQANDIFAELIISRSGAPSPAQAAGHGCPPREFFVVV
jgi:hypothetical protein